MDFSASHASFDEAEKALKAQAHALGFDLAVKERFPRGAKGEAVMRVNYRCSKGRTKDSMPRNAGTHDSKKRKTSTQMTDCPFRINLKREGGSWRLFPVLTKDGTELTHNHDFVAATAFPAYRLQSLDAFKAQIIPDWRAGTRPAQILANLREKGAGVDFSYNDLMNLVKRCRREELQGRTPIQWLYEVRQLTLTISLDLIDSITDARVFFAAIGQRDGLLLSRSARYGRSRAVPVHRS